MSAKTVLTDWSGPEEIVYMPRQFSMRLSVKMAAFIAALCETYPRKNKGEIINDLLTLGVEQILKELSSYRDDKPFDWEDDGTCYFEDRGQRGNLIRLAQLKLKEIKAEENITSEISIPNAVITGPME